MLAVRDANVIFQATTTNSKLKTLQILIKNITSNLFITEPPEIGYLKRPFVGNNVASVLSAIKFSCRIVN